MRWFSRSDIRSFYFLNATQFLGALNDNIFKLLVIYLLIHLQGPQAANTILSLAGAIFVIPFLLFSSSAGLLADRISKRSIIVFTKILEIVIMVFGLLSVMQNWGTGSYICLFFMAAQSALFGPSKYGIIPELVEEKRISKANGSMTSFTYLAIILGTFLASFITDITNKNFVFEASFCVLVAVIGFLASLGIRRTEPQRSTKKITPFFLYEIYRTLKFSWKIPHLLPALFGSSFFLFIGAFAQLNIIPFAMQSLGLSEVGGGYLFLATAVGIAAGAVLAGQLSKDKVEPGISCIAGFIIGVAFILLWIFSNSLSVSILLLVVLGIAGGGFLIPFEAFIQVKSPKADRGQVIAAANFFGFIGVLLAAMFLYFFNEKLGFSAASSFAAMGFITLAANVIVAGRISALFFPFFIQKILKRFRKLRVVSSLPTSSDLIILESRSWWDPVLLFSCLPNLKILVPGPYLRHFPWFNGWIESFRIVPSDPSSLKDLEKLFRLAKKLQKKDTHICLFFHKKWDNKEIMEVYKKTFGRFSYDLIYAHGTKEKVPKRFFFCRYMQRQISLSFSKEG